VGRFKAPFFESLGYSAESWQRLETDLRMQHLPQEAVMSGSDAHGQKYEIRAPLAGPEKQAAVVSVWIVRTGEDVARFVTAYPEG
jgi:hypothetical protein